MKVNSNQKQINESKSLYKCHYCKQKIDRNDIEEHLMIFHKFINSDENVCLVCDLVFNEYDHELLEHIQNVHEGENQTKSAVEIESLEDGKSNFLELMSNFKSQKDVFNFLYWIKCNNTDIFLDPNQETKTEFPIIEENLTNPKEDTLEVVEILDEDIANSFVEQHYQVTSISNDDTLIKNEFIKDDFDEEIVKNEIIQDNDEEYKEENGRNSALEPSDYDKTETCRPKQENKFMCSECQKAFFTRSHLLKHINSVHRGLKPYKCNSCEQSFFHSSGLKTHIKNVHEGRRDHNCNACPKSFSTAPKLKRHIDVVHKGHKDFKCDSCSKAFSERGILKKHIHTVHEGHKGYKCESCSKSFSKTGDLKKHLPQFMKATKITNVNFVVNHFLK